ncbi:MAG TPA: DUF3105 domain-containing protein [Kineosporiaceae bacterium]|nr:DUF3105 domain-containing protein [Kineosporiaceae bacterium]
MAKTAEKDRKARLEQMRKQQQATERKRTMLVVGAAVAAVLVLTGVVFKAVRDAQADKDVANVGVASAAAASCDAPTNDPVQGSGVHVGPGTNKPDVKKVDYKTVPPTSGEHFVEPAYPAAAFYTKDDRPAMETLVHNLEHGYTIVWYTSATPQAQVDQLKKISDLTRAMKETNGKFIVSAWDDAYGAFPAGKTIGMSHWGAKTGHRQLCGGVSGTAIKAFVTQFPATDAPEPYAQ